MFNSVFAQLYRSSNSQHHGVGTGNTLPGNFKCSTVVNRCTDDGQAQGDVDLSDTGEVEGAHRHLRAGLADRLGADDAGGLRRVDARLVVLGDGEVGGLLELGVREAAVQAAVVLGSSAAP